MIFSLLVTPFFLSLLLIIIVVAVLNYSLSGFTFWYSYVLLLVYLGGVLVLFTYVSSVFPFMLEIPVTWRILWIVIVLRVRIEMFRFVKLFQLSAEFNGLSLLSSALNIRLILAFLMFMIVVLVVRVRAIFLVGGPIRQV